MGRRKKPTQRVTEYYTSIQYGVCHGPVERLISIRVNEKVIGNCSQLRGPVIYIDSPELFGGIKKEGGLRGRMAWQSGTEDQLLDAYVAAKKGASPSQFPGYRGIATAFFTELPSQEPVGVNTVVGGYRGVVGTLAAALGRAIQRTGRSGFYWSANQPIIPPVHFRVTRVDREWRPDIASIPGAIDVANYAICIAIDTSGSMASGTRLATAKAAAVALLEDLKASGQSGTFDVRVVSWNTSTVDRQHRNCSQAAYDDLISFVNGLTTGSGTVFTAAVSGLESFYAGSGGKCRLFVFLTDGEPDSSANADEASATLMATGADSYAFNLELSNTTQTAKMDNTPGDGVPLVSLGTAPSRLRNLFRTSVTQQVDMNPAHIIRECLTNSVWGLGLPDTALDMDMFESAAETLFDERFGLSMMWTRQAEIQEFVGDILSHIQATVYVNPMNGKLSLKLIRNDYDPNTLPVLNASNSKVTSFKRRSPAEITNEITVTWTNPTSEKEEVVTLQSLGSIVANNGEIVSDNRNYYGVRRAELAAELCARDLAASTAPLSTAEVEADRSFSRTVPGDVVKLTDSENGAFETIMRVMKVDYGQPGSSKIQLTLTEDVFSYSKPMIILPPVSANTNVPTFPSPPDSIEVFTVNTYMNQSLSDGIDDLVDPETQVGFLIATNQQDTFNADIFQEVPTNIGTTEFETIGEFDLVGWAALSEPLPGAVESELVLPMPTVGQTPALGTFAFIGPVGLPEDLHEIVLISEFDATTGLWKIRRGMMDTVPWDWPAGTPIRYLDQQMRFLNTNTATSGVAEDFRVHTRTSLGVLPDELAPVVTYTPTDRLYAPSRPANVTVAGVSFGVVDAADLTSVEVTWAHRNRLTEDAVLLGWDEASVTPEDGQSTTVRLIDSDTDTTIIEYSGLTGTSHSFDTADCGSASMVRVAVFAVRDGFESIQGHEVVLDLSPLLPPLGLAGEVI